MVTEVWKFMYSLSLDIAEPNRYKKTKSNSLVLSINKQQKMQQYEQTTKNAKMKSFENEKLLYRCAKAPPQ